MLKLAGPEDGAPMRYVATCAFTEDKFVIVPENIFVEFQDDGVMFVVAYVGKKLIFSQQCQSLHIDDERAVKRVPKIKVSPKERKPNV